MGLWAVIINFIMSDFHAWKESIIGTLICYKDTVGSFGCLDRAELIKLAGQELMKQKEVGAHKTAAASPSNRSNV